jgi:MFS family permease
VYGLGIGFSMHGAPAYIGEMSPPAIRGLLISLKEAVIVVGILCGYLVGFLMSEVKGGWAYVFGIATIPACVMFCGSFLLHESSRWLFLNGREAEAEAGLQWVLPQEQVDVAMQDMALQDGSGGGSGGGGNTQRIPSKVESRDNTTDTTTLLRTEKPSVWNMKYKSALLAGVGLVFLQQVTGQPSVLYYAATIFDDAGLAGVATVGMAAFKLVMTMTAVFTVDKFGRKILLYTGISVMLVALVALSIAFSFAPASSDDDTDDDKSVSGVQIAILIALFTYIGGYQIGFGPIAWLLISEVFPLEVRGQAVALAVQTNFFWNVITSYLFPVIVSALGPAWTFGIFALVDAYALYHVFAYIPETKGLSLEEIENLFDPTRTKKARGTSRDSVQRPLLGNLEEEE